MSIPLPEINLAGVAVGTSGVVSLQNTGISAGGISANPAGSKNAGILHIFNESGCGLLITFQSGGNGFHLPAGGWIDKVIQAGESGFSWTVLYILPSPPVSLLLVTYYYPGEPVPRVPILGNSPIGGQTNVATGQIFFVLASPTITSGDSITSGSTKTYTCTGISGIPVGATGILLSYSYSSAAANTALAFTPHGTVYSNGNYPASNPASVSSSIGNFGAFTVPVDSNGQIDAKALNGNITSLDIHAYGYVF